MFTCCFLFPLFFCSSKRNPSNGGVVLFFCFFFARVRFFSFSLTEHTHTHTHNDVDDRQIPSAKLVPGGVGCGFLKPRPLPGPAPSPLGMAFLFFFVDLVFFLRIFFSFFFVFGIEGKRDGRTKRKFPNKMETTKTTTTTKRRRAAIFFRSQSQGCCCCCRPISAPEFIGHQSPVTHTHTLTND